MCCRRCHRLLPKRPVLRVCSWGRQVAAKSGPCSFPGQHLGPFSGPVFKARNCTPSVAFSCANVCFFSARAGQASETLPPLQGGGKRCNDFCTCRAGSEPGSSLWQTHAPPKSMGLSALRRKRSRRCDCARQGGLDCLRSIELRVRVAEERVGHRFVELGDTISAHGAVSVFHVLRGPIFGPACCSWAAQSCNQT